MTWDRYMQGWIGNIVYVFLGFLLAYSINLGLGFAFNTQTPVVSVVSGSMEHTAESGIICGKFVGTYSPDSYWDVCGSWYEANNISKSEFSKFPFSNGFNKGDILFVMNSENISIGDVIVFDAPGYKYPIIHRVVFIDKDGNIYTKGDHNPAPDRWKITRDKVYGKAVLMVPYLGWVKIGLMEALEFITG